MGGTGKSRPPHVKRIGAAGIGAGLLALPVYAAANVLFETAILRDNSNSLLEQKWMKQLMGRLDEVFSKRAKPQEGERGLGFDSFTDVVETGKQWFWAQ